jgi:sulfite exporter TauE/SafE
VLMAISAMGFLVFGSAFGALFGFIFDVGTLWPLFLIGIGVITLISAIFRRR